MGYAQRAARAWAGLATAVAGLSVVAVFGLATPAAADVTFDSKQGQRTGGARVAFRVTNEHPTASITKVEVRFPDVLRLPEVYPIAVGDWAPSIIMEKVDDNPANDFSRAVVWITMPGKDIKPGASSVLPLAMGPMPDREAVYLDVIQTRSDGTVETWAGVDVPAAGAQHPALRLDLVPLAPGQQPEYHHGGPATGAPPVDVAADPVADDAEEGSSGTVGLAAVLLLIAALTVFALYWQRRRGAARGAEAEDEAGESPGFRVPAQRRRPSAPAKSASAPQKAAPSKAAAPKNAAPAKKAAAPKKAPALVEAPSASVATEKADSPASPGSPGGKPAVAVQRRSVVRTSATRTAGAGRRAAVRKSAGGAGTVTVARRGANTSKRAANTDGDNA